MLPRAAAVLASRTQPCAAAAAVARCLCPQLLDVLNSPRPVSFDAAPAITLEHFNHLLGMKRQCEAMVGQLNAIRAKRPSMARPQVAPLGGHGAPGAPGGLAMTPAGYGGAAATPDEVRHRACIACAAAGSKQAMQHSCAAKPAAADACDGTQYLRRMR